MAQERKSGSSHLFWDDLKGKHVPPCLRHPDQAETGSVSVYSPKTLRRPEQMCRRESETEFRKLAELRRKNTVWYATPLCAGSHADLKTCSRVWMKNRHSSPSLHLRPPGNEEQTEKEKKRKTEQHRRGREKWAFLKNTADCSIFAILQKYYRFYCNSSAWYL